MLSKLFGFRKEKKIPEDAVPTLEKNWSFLGVDMHSHLIPGIDDGAQTVEDSIVLIERLQSMGFKSLVTTPHIKSDHFPNTAAIIQQGLKNLRQELAERNINVPVRAAAEYYIDDHFLDLLERRELMPVTGNEVLVEVSFLVEPIKFHDILFRMQMADYRPILAHPERYSFYHNKTDAYRELKNRGCLLQLNTIALTGYYGKPVKQAAERNLKEGLYSYCGSDMHHFKHADVLHNMLGSSILAELQRYPFLNSRLDVDLL
jgi:tyrosine-protein phosphatase YwqE